eukprot:scaffold56198_cov19-Tisochrysis_lutea.AAC.1
MLIKLLPSFVFFCKDPVGLHSYIFQRTGKFRIVKDTRRARTRNKVCLQQLYSSSTAVSQGLWSHEHASQESQHKSRDHINMSPDHAHAYQHVAVAVELVNGGQYA